MSSCSNEIKIIGLIEDELIQQEKEKLTSHLEQCPYCRSLYYEYTALKSDTAAYYSSIDFYSKHAVVREKAAVGKIFRKTAFAFSAAASFILGFLLVMNNMNTDNNNNFNNDSTYNITEEPSLIINEAEWSLEFNLIRLKIELLSEQIKQ
jgi:hypothetical protein